MNEVPEPFDTQYHDCTAKHFHEKLVDGSGCNRLREKLQIEGRVRKAKRRGAHRRKRPRRPMPGMMPHRDGSTHERVPGRTLDPVRPMDDATNEAHSGIFVVEEGTVSGFRGTSGATPDSLGTFTGLPTCLIALPTCCSGLRIKTRGVLRAGRAKESSRG